MKVRDDGAPFAPMLLLFQVDNAVWDREILAETPFVTCTKAGGDGVQKVFVDVR